MRRARLRSRGLTRASELRRECTDLCRSIVLERDRWACRSCKATYESGAVLQVAHIKPKKRYRSLQFALDNLALLCKPCHWKQHCMSYPDQQAFFARIVGIELLEHLEMRARLIQKTDLVATKAFLMYAERRMVGPCPS